MIDPMLSPRSPIASTAFLAAFWAGMLAGVSFLATPAKFQAASLSLPVALEVGHVTFRAFIKVEWGLAILLAAAAIFSKGSRLVLSGAILVGLIVAVETFWLLPVLDTRVGAVIAGAPLPPSWVLAQACRDAAGWPNDIRVAVNLSPTQFRTQDVFAEVQSALNGACLPPRRLMLEITEYVQLEQTEAGRTLHGLRELGVGISLDEFGTG